MIKKILSIATILLILTAMLHFSVATHYCGGVIAESKISLSGELATCGMESGLSSLPASGLSFSTHCCDDDISFYAVIGSYFPSHNIILNHFQQNIQTFGIIDNISRNTIISHIIRISESPPGPSNYNSVDLDDLCTYRI